MNHDPITDTGRRLLDAGSPGPWEWVPNFGPTAIYAQEHEPGQFVAQHVSVPDTRLIVWMRNNLPAILDRLAHWATILDAGATVLEHNATMLEHLTMDTLADQALTDEAVAGTRRAAHAMRAALNRDRT